MANYPKPPIRTIDRSVTVSQEPEIAFVQAMLMANVMSGRYPAIETLIYKSVEAGLEAGAYYRERTGKPKLEQERNEDAA